jgi:hypothetical protein
MRLHRALLLFGLVMMVSSIMAPPTSAQECPCRMTSRGVCVRDTECEARIRAQARDPSAASRRYYRRSSPPASPQAAPVARPPQPPAGSQRPITTVTSPSAGAPRQRIIDTGYGQLTEIGGEAPDFGLYSYVILPTPSERATRLLTEIFTDVPAISDLPTNPPQHNILYIPLRKESAARFNELRQRLGRTPDRMAADYAATFYDYRTARGLLHAVCNPPADSIREFCAGDLSRGPYLFTYAAPASTMRSVPPPFLFVDLSDVHGDAFRELLAAFNEQVKRDDITDRARIETLRLRVLQYLLRAGDLVGPMKNAIDSFVHAAADKPASK